MSMRKAFLKYLADEGMIDQAEVDRFHDRLRAAPEPIGAIAFRYGMITGGEIDEILDDQRHDDRPFGEIAIAKGLLSAEQVNTLLCVQQIRAATESAEALALSNVIRIDELAPKLGHFLYSVQENVLSAT
jgi:hypothetical protein